MNQIGYQTWKVKLSQNCAVFSSLLWFFLSICVKIVEWSQYCGVKSVLSGVEWVEVKSVLNSTSNLLQPSPSLANSKLINTTYAPFDDQYNDSESGDNVLPSLSPVNSKLINTARLVMIMIIMMISMMMILIIIIIICFHLSPLLIAN